MVFVVSILLVAFFLLMNAFFVVAEFSLVRVRNRRSIFSLKKAHAVRNEQKRFPKM